MKYTTNDFSATLLLGIDSATTNFQQWTLLRGANDFSVITHADYAKSGTWQDFTMAVFHISKIALVR